jgi:hypothetical protein
MLEMTLYRKRQVVVEAAMTYKTARAALKEKQ